VAEGEPSGAAALVVLARETATLLATGLARVLGSRAPLRKRARCALETSAMALYSSSPSLL